MARIIDLTEADDEPEILTSTTVSGGLLGGGELLSTVPLETYLDDQEQPKYAARNDKAGLIIERADGTERIEPDDEYQAVALVTDLRVLFAVGRQQDDRTLGIPLPEVVEAKASAGRFRESELGVHTVADEHWRFRCKADVGPVATAIDELAQLWTHAQRLLDEVEAQVSSAEAALNRSTFGRARDELGDAEHKIRRALDRIAEVGPAATARIESRARTVSDELLDVKRELTAAEGAKKHAEAQRAWDEQSYEAAARRYERAIEAYETALSTDGPEPPDGSLESRLAGAVRERELLRAGPLVDADSARRRALDEPDPEEAAGWWERALDGYRELLSLDWGRQTREFVVDRDKIREQTVSIADDAIEDHIQAGRQWVRSGDRLAVDGHDEQARVVYERAREQFENAEQVASEVRPEHLDDIADVLDLIEERLAGDVPDEPPDESALETVVITGFETEPETRGDSGGSGVVSGGEGTQTDADLPAEPGQQPPSSQTGVNDGSTGRSGRRDESTGAGSGDGKPRGATDDTEADDSSPPQGSAGVTDSAAFAPAEVTGSESPTGTPEPDDCEPDSGGTGQNSDSDTIEGENRGEEEPSLLDQIRSHKRNDSSNDTSSGDRSRDQSGSHSPGDPRQCDPEEVSAGNDVEHHRKGTEWQGNQPQPSLRVEDRLARLSGRQFDSLIAELWEGQGWTTTVVSDRASNTFDVVALSEAPEERLGIWTIHRPDGVVHAEDVAECQEALVGSRGAESATIVTTGDVTTTAQSALTEHSIAVVDTGELGQLLRSEDLTERLRSLSDG